MDKEFETLKRAVALFVSTSNSDESCSDRRRHFLVSATMAFVSGMIPFQQDARAIPMVSVDEFAIILRDSPLSVSVVEFSGTLPVSRKISLQRWTI